MRRCKGASGGIVLVLLTAGCASLDETYDPSAYALPGDTTHAPTGFFGQTTDHAMKSAKAAFGLGPDEEVGAAIFRRGPSALPHCKRPSWQTAGGSILRCRW